MTCQNAGNAEAQVDLADVSNRNQFVNADHGLLE